MSAISKSMFPPSNLLKLPDHLYDLHLKIKYTWILIYVLQYNFNGADSCYIVIL